MLKPIPSDIPDRPFGDDHSWSDVQSHVSRIIRQKFPVYDYETLQDVLADVLIDLLGYWSTLPSSRQEDGTFSFRYAIQRGCWMGKRKMWEAQRHNIRHVRISFAEANDWDEDDAGEPMKDWVNPYSVLLDEDTSLEHVGEDLDEASRAHQLLASMKPEELVDYFDTILSGDTVGEVAERLNITHQSVSDRKAVRLRRLRDKATKFGLVS